MEDTDDLLNNYSIMSTPNIQKRKRNYKTNRISIDAALNRLD